jgi:ferredoxin
MIITRQKHIKDILCNIEDGPVFIVGCSECATVCHTGGEEEVLLIKKELEQNKINVTGWVVLDPACHFLNDKRLLKNHKDEIGKAKKILVLACGNGVQTVSEIIESADIIPGTDTLFLGEIKRLNDFQKRCSLCGECIQDLFGGFCPISRCPKEMLNGPCGGSIDGKCEINNDLECIWDTIFLQFKKKGQIDKLKEIKRPKNWSKSTEMKRIL